MKKVFLLAATAILVLASCTKNQIIETPSDQKTIGFSAFTHLSTKALPITGTNIITEAADIKVYSYLMNGTTGTTTTNTAFFNDVLNYTAPSWQTDPVRYWPSTTVGTATKSLSFFAFYPFDAAVSNYAADNYLSSSANKPSFTYTVPAVANQKDLLVASKEHQTYTGCATDGQIDFQFAHALSQIAFSAKGKEGNLKYYVKEITIGNSDIKNVGTYTYGGSMVATAAAGTENYTYNPTSYPVITGTTTPTDAVAFTDGNPFLMLMPQTIALKVTVKYYVTDTETPANNILGDSTTPVTKTVTLTSGTWEGGKKYTYILTLPSDTYPITYSVAVTNWSDATDTGVSF